MPYLGFVPILTAFLGLSAIAWGSDCLIGTPVVPTGTPHFVESVVWRLQATDATPEIDPSETRKSEALLTKILELMNNGSNDRPPGYLLSQDDLGVLSEFVQTHGYGFYDLLQVKARLEAESGLAGRFRPKSVKSEALRFVSDLAWVRGRMDEFKRWNSEAGRSPDGAARMELKCRFAYGQLMKTTILDQNVNQVWNENGLNSGDPRRIIGNCWWTRKSSRLISEPPEGPALQELRETE